MYYYEEKSYDSKPRKAFRRFRFEYTTYISPLLSYAISFSILLKIEELFLLSTLI